MATTTTRMRMMMMTMSRRKIVEEVSMHLPFLPGYGTTELSSAQTAMERYCAKLEGGWPVLVSSLLPWKALRGEETTCGDITDASGKNSEVKRFQGGLQGSLTMVAEMRKQRQKEAEEKKREGRKRKRFQARLC